MYLFILGMITVAIIWFSHVQFHAWKSRKTEREFLNLQAKLYGIMPKPGESNLDLRNRLVGLLKGPIQ